MRAELELDDGSLCTVMPQVEFVLRNQERFQLQWKQWKLRKSEDMEQWAAKNPVKFQGLRMGGRTIGKVLPVALGL